MRKNYKRITIILLIITMLFAVAPFYKANADVANNTIYDNTTNNTDDNSVNAIGNSFNNTNAPTNIDFEHDEITYGCVTIKTYPLNKDSKSGYFDLEVVGNNLPNDLAGFSGTLTGYGIRFGLIPTDVYAPLYGAEVLTDGWKITSGSNSSNEDKADEYLDYVSFTVEKNDLTTSGNSVTLRIYFTILAVVPDEYLSIGLGNVTGFSKFVTADAYNNIDKPLDGLGYDNQMFIALKRNDKYLVEAKTEEDGKTIAINRNTKNIYFKTNKQDNGIGSLADLFNKLEFDENNIKYFYIAFKENIATTGNLLGFVYRNGGWKIESSAEFNEESSFYEILNNARNSKSNFDFSQIPLMQLENQIYFCGNIYTLNELGDVWQEEEEEEEKEDDADSENINIKDVSVLRMAIVGYKTTLNNEYFNIKCSDVNFSNDNFDELGDIGDVISIRLRIVNGEWADIEE